MKLLHDQRIRDRLAAMFFKAWRRRQQRKHTSSPEHIWQTVRATVAKSSFCMLLTSGPAGESRARMVQPIAEVEQPRFWIGTSPGSRKVRDVIASGEATLSFQRTRAFTYVVFYCEAEIEDAPALRRRYWRPEWYAFFPDGPEGDDYVLIVCQPWRIEVMSFTANITPEPFGLRPAVLRRSGETWHLDTE